MMLEVPGVLTKGEVAQVRALIDPAGWVDGNLTSGPQAKLAKRNRQLPWSEEGGKEAGRRILSALQASNLFFSAALPRTILPPLFNRYGEGDGFGEHVDNAIRANPHGGALRTDVSITLFLSEPEDYDGGELIVEDTYGAHEVKLNAGDAIVYPASSLHRVAPIARGERVAAFFWAQSLVRDDARRALLFNMDAQVQRLTGMLGAADPSVIALTGTYHNLLRMWSEV